MGVREVAADGLAKAAANRGAIFVNADRLIKEGKALRNASIDCVGAGGMSIGIRFGFLMVSPFRAA
jgi:hypothetical protein